MSDKNSKNCKALYMQLIKVIEAYEKCNFVKGSFAHSVPSDQNADERVDIRHVSACFTSRTRVPMNVRSDNAAPNAY